ncbi:MAG TPA: ABC transporter permease, partial [Candidatus Limnocylindrales bacterium]
VSEAHRDRRGLPALESLLQDLRHAVRGLASHRGFAAACILTLALGIGVNSAIFSVVNAVLFAPLPYADPGRLITIWTSHPEIRREANALSRENALDLARTMTTLDGLGLVQANIISASMPIDGEGVLVNAAQVTPRVFEVLGTPALYGRTLQEGDDASVIVLSHSFWQRQFGGDPNVVGRVFGEGRSSGRVVGVMPRGFTLPYPSMLQATVSFVASSDVDFWIAGRDIAPGRTERDVRMYAVVARVKEGVSMEQAGVDLANAWRSLTEAFPSVNGGWSAHAVPLHAQAVGPVRSAMLLLLGSVGVVLLIACVNVANLMLARGVARQRELALRAALGARRSRLLQQVLVEGLVLSSIGAALGLVFARLVTPVLVALAPSGTPRLTEVSTDVTVVLFTITVAVICGMAVSVVPALSASRVQARALGDGGRAVAGGRRGVRGTLVAVEVGLAVVLAIGAGLLGRSFLAVLDVDPGFRADHLLTMQVTAPAQLATPDQRVDFYRRLFERIEAVPGVVSVGGNTRLPLGGTNSTTPVAVDGRVPPDGQWPEADFRRAVHRYFETMQIPLRRGRLFTEADHATAPPVVVINEALARRMFGEADPIGEQLRLGPSSPVRQATIVGIVGDLRHQRLDAAPLPEVYIHYLQGVPNAPLLAIRTSDDPARLAPAIRAAMRDVDPSIVPINVRTMDDLRTASVSDRVFLMALVVSFGALALVLAAVGVYGVLSLVVAERTRELGIRLALGASPGGLMAHVVGHALLLTASGVAGGLVVALLLSPLVSNQLFGVGASDPLTMAGVAGVLLAVALAAAAIPASRVLRVDPVSTLRCD